MSRCSHAGFLISSVEAGFETSKLLVVELTNALNEGACWLEAEVIVAALTPQMSGENDEENLFRTMEHVAIMLPGLGEPVPVRIDAESPAVDRSLAELNIRGKTGATILVITRLGDSGAKIVVPSGHETVRVGDVLALAGTQINILPLLMYLREEGAIAW